MGLAAAALAVTLGEIYLRWRVSPATGMTVSFGPFDWLEYDPILGWQNRAGYRGPAFQINGLHFRGDEVPAARPPDRQRIICLGDSRTFGIWLDLGRFRYDNAYPAPLEELLRAGGAQVEVLNAGVVGYTSAHGLRLFATSLAELRPDILVVALGFNDHALAWNPALGARELRTPVLRDVFYGLAGLRTFALGVSAYRAMASWNASVLTAAWAKPEEYAYNLRRLVAASHARGVRLLFLDLPLRPLEMGESAPAFPGAQAFSLPGLHGVNDLWALHQLDRTYRDIMTAVAAETQTPLADLAAAFAAWPGAPLYGSYDVAHYRDTAAVLVARTVHDRLRELGWITRRPIARTPDVPAGHGSPAATHTARRRP